MYMNKPVLELNNLPRLIYHKTQSNKTGPIKEAIKDECIITSSSHSMPNERTYFLTFLIIPVITISVNI